ncbi:MAG: HDIG domain-containing protein [Patescibacteria group bacterium]|nr:MAG: HDIG domain-containing protein [Patescibacteria group bacterium]
MKISQAKELLYKWVQSESLRGHCESVAKSMRGLAEFYVTQGEAENVENWVVTGLLHDFDYEKYPSLTEHPYKGVEYLRSIGVDEEILKAILGHSHETGVKRVSLMAKALFAVDELSGFVVAIAKVRPGGFEGMEVSSVKKKLKDKAFAAAVSREDIRLGAEELGLELEKIIDLVIEAQRSEL